MKQYVIYQVQYSEGEDIDGTDPERWQEEIGRFNTEDEALAFAFVATHWTDCEVVEE
jgi:hypothetical protein